MHTGILIAAVPYALIGLAGWRARRTLRRRGAAARPVPTAAADEAVLVHPAFVLGAASFAVQAQPAQTVLEDVLRALDAEAARGPTRLTIAVTPGLALRADPAALRQVLHDMVRGAIRRTPHGRVLVCAALHGGRVQVSVTDEGVGADTYVLAGLSETTRGIVALHGGTLEAHRQHGGATVVLRLPAPTARPRTPAPIPARSEAAPAGASGRAAAATARRALATAGG